jgi:hypothetical protein
MAAVYLVARIVKPGDGNVVSMVTGLQNAVKFDTQ